MSAQLIADGLLEQAELLKHELGEFEPFGLLLLSNLSLKNVNLLSDRAQTKDRIELLKKLLEVDTKDCNVLGSGLIFEVILNQADAFCIQLLSHNSDGWITTYLPFKLNKDDGVFEYGHYQYDK